MQELTRRLPSRTCKRLAEICAPMLFRSISLKEVDEERHSRLAENAQQLGGFVRHLKLTLEDGLADNDNLPIYRLLSSMPNVRSLIVVHRQQDVAKHTPLQRAVEKFVHLEEVTLREKSYNPGHTHVSTPMVVIADTFFHAFLCSVLRVHSERLRGFHLYTLLRIDPKLYIQLRDKTPNLRSVTFTTNIDLVMEDVFAEATPWASGQTGNLANLTFLGCNGTHANRFVENILRGVYGVQLEEIQFISSGRYIAHIPEPPSTPVFRSIVRMHFDHVTREELIVIAVVPIQELSLTRITYHAFCHLPVLLERVSSNYGGGFMGLRRLRLSAKFASEILWEMVPSQCKATYERLREKCLPQRCIQLTLDAADRPIICTCSDHFSC